MEVRDFFLVKEMYVCVSLKPIDANLHYDGRERFENVEDEEEEDKWVKREESEA